MVVLLFEGHLVSLALVEHVHVALANVDFTAILLQARQKVLIEREARVLLLLLLLSGSLLRLTVVVVLLAAFLSVLWMLLFGRFATVAAASTAHHATDSHVSRGATSTESCTLRHRGTQTLAAKHAATLSLLLWWGLSRGWLPRGRPRHIRCSCRTAPREETTATTT